VIDFDGALRIEAAAHEGDAHATRAGALTGGVHTQPRVARDIKQVLARGLMSFVHLLEFKPVEPDAAATAVANIHCD
jgi:hypothetical protein